MKLDTNIHHVSGVSIAGKVIKVMVKGQGHMSTNV